MEEDIINNILKDLENSIENNGKFIKLPDDDYESIEINKDNFHEITESVAKNKIAYIDGGNSEIFKGANFSLQFIRIYYTIYQDNKRISNKKYEFYLLIKSLEKENKIFYKTAIFGDKIINDLEFDSFDKTITKGVKRGDISSIGDIVRRFSELKVAYELIEKLEKDDSIILDGSLDATYSNENKMLEALDNSKGVKICALSKTCELFTDKGGSIITSLNEISPDYKWYYHPIATTKEIYEILFIKLHEKSKYIFRLDIFKNQIKDINKILSNLQLNSKDPVFIGYPYALIEADRFARITNKEIELLKTRFMIKAGKDWKNINNSLKTKDSHNILDNI